MGGDLGQSYHGDYFVRLKPDHARSTPAVMADVLAKVQAQVPGVEVELAQLMEDLIGDLTAVPQPIEVKLYGPDPAALIPQAEKVAAAISKVNGVVEVKSGVKLAGDALDVRIDPVRAGQEGVTPDEVTQAVNTALSGAVATQMPEAIKAVGVRVRLPDALNLKQADVADLPVRASDGHVFPLHRVARLVPITGQPQISRDNLQPMIAVTGRIEGRGIGAAVGDVRRVLDQQGMLASGTRYELGGLYQQQQIAFAGLARVFAAALVAEFVLLLFLYERFSLPLVIIACSLLSTTAVFTGLWIAGVELNITALMGMTMIVGISTEMAIFYVSEYAELARAYGAAAGATRCQPQPPAADHYDDAGGDPHLAAAGLRHRPGFRHPAAACHRNHRGPAVAVPARAAGHAGPDLADPASQDQHVQCQLRQGQVHRNDCRELFALTCE